MTATKPRAARRRRNAPRKKAPKKTPAAIPHECGHAGGGPATWNSEEAKTPAALTRAALLTNIPDPEIKAAVAKRFPSYKAVDICVSVYRRELRKKGLLR